MSLGRMSLCSYFNQMLYSSYKFSLCILTGKGFLVMLTDDICYFLLCFSERNAVAKVMHWPVSVMHIPPAFMRCKHTMQRFVFPTQDCDVRKPQSISDCKQHSFALVTTMTIMLKELGWQERKCVFKYMHGLIKARRRNYPEHISNTQPHCSKCKDPFLQMLSGDGG